MTRTIYTVDSIKEIWSLLGLFESKKYVYDKLKLQDLTANNLENRTEQIVYSVRQAREFFSSAKEVSLLTSPLLLSYGMLNLAKALVYFSSPQETDFSNYFKKHGLMVPYNTLDLSLKNEYVKFQGYGTYSQMAMIYGEPTQNNVQISIKDLIAQIPDLREMYILTYNEYPRVTPLRQIEYGYSMKDLEGHFQTVWDQILEMQEIFQGSGYHIQGMEPNISILGSIAVSKSLNELGIIFKLLSGIQFFRTIPKISNNLLTIKETSIHYLIMFTYGMLARYQPVRWGKYIDTNLSCEAEIINKSIYVCQNRFLHQIINCLFEEDFEFRLSIEQIEKSRQELADYIYEDVIKRMERDLNRIW